MKLLDCPSQSSALLEMCRLCLKAVCMPGNYANLLISTVSAQNSGQIISLESNQKLVEGYNEPEVEVKPAEKLPDVLFSLHLRTDIKLLFTFTARRFCLTLFS